MVMLGECEVAHRCTEARVEAFVAFPVIHIANAGLQPLKACLDTRPVIADRGESRHSGYHHSVSEPHLA